MYGRLEVCGEDAFGRHGEGKDIINGYTDREKKSYCFENGCPRQVSEVRSFVFIQNSNNDKTKIKVPNAKEMIR